jgi:hypothetical protein
LECAKIHKERKTERNLEKYHFGGSSKKNAAEHGVKFRGLRVRESDVNASKMPSFPK